MLIGALLGYPLYAFISLFSDIAFQKIVHYSIVLTSLGLCFYYLKASGVANEVLGFTLKKQQRQQNLIKGFIFGAALLLIVESCLYLMDMRQQDPDLSDGALAFMITLIKAVISGLLVGIIEEITYRGAIFSGLKRFSNVGIAIVASSLLYAAVHFIKFSEVPAESDIGLFSGISILADGFFLFTDPTIIDSFITLFFLGCLLSLVRLYTGNIVQCIGLHAGIVTMDKIMSYSTDYKSDSSFEFLVNRQDGLNGWLASSWLVIAIVIYWHFIFRPQRAT